MPSTASRRSRPVTDVKALQQLVDCVGMSARKRVLDSGREPRLLVLRNWDGMMDDEDEPEEEIVRSGEGRLGGSTGWTPSPFRTLDVSADSGFNSSRREGVEAEEEEEEGTGTQRFARRIKELESKRRMIVGELEKVKDGLVGVKETVDKW